MDARTLKTIRTSLRTPRNLLRGHQNPVNNSQNSVSTRNKVTLIKDPRNVLKGTKKSLNNPQTLLHGLSCTSSPLRRTISMAPGTLVASVCCWRTRTRSRVCLVLISSVCGAFREARTRTWFIWWDVEETSGERTPWGFMKVPRLIWRWTLCFLWCYCVLHFFIASDDDATYLRRSLVTVDIKAPKRWWNTGRKSPVNLQRHHFLFFICRRLNFSLIISQIDQNELPHFLFRAETSQTFRVT